MLKRYNKEDPSLGRLREQEFEEALKDYMSMDRNDPDLQWTLEYTDGRTSPTDDPLRY